MTHGEAVQDKLSKATTWVVEEFGFLDELFRGLGCEPHAKRGTGIAYRLEGRGVVHLHVKLRHLAIGLPRALRAEVDTLNNVARVPREHAWLTYEPGVCDREQLEGLVLRAFEGATPDRVRAGAPVRAARDDEADLALVLAVVRAYADHERATGRPSGTKVVREAIYFAWEHPRLPPGGKYSPRLPHSPAARAHRSGGNKKGLVFEHVLPISVVVRRLLREVPDDVQALRAVLNATADRVIVTKDEDSRITAAGLGAAAPDEDDPWSRYGCLDLTRQEFTPMTG